MKLAKMIGLMWALPVTLVGAVYALTFQSLGWLTLVGRREMALVWKLNENVPSWLQKAWKSWAGHTIGNVVVLAEHPDSSKSTQMVLTHELEHVDQCMRLGIFQPIMYGLMMLTMMLIKHSKPYADNPFEQAARRGAGEQQMIIDAVKSAVKGD